MYLGMIMDSTFLPVIYCSVIVLLGKIYTDVVVFCTARGSVFLAEQDCPKGSTINDWGYGADFREQFFFLNSLSYFQKARKT